MICRKLPMQTLVKLHLSNRLLVCLLVIACFEKSIYRSSSSLIETSQLTCIANWLTAFFVMREVRGFCLISGCGVSRCAHSFCRVLVELPMNLRRLQFYFILFYLFFSPFFSGGFSRRGIGEVSVFCAA